MRFISLHLMPGEELTRFNVESLDCYKDTKPGPTTPIGAKGMIVVRGAPLKVKETFQEMRDLIEPTLPVKKSVV